MMPRPFLRWAGSKRQLVPMLARFWGPQHTRYVEPFAGSACLFFDLQPSRARLGDINRGLIELYECVRDEPETLAAKVHRFDSSREEYLRVRAVDPAQMDRLDRAARFLYLNRYCFNGLYRTNKLGQFNVPWGGNKSGSLPTADTLAACSRLLQQTDLIAGDFEETLAGVSAGDFVYMDPPFRIAARRTFRQYDPASFSNADLERLRATLKRMADTKVSFVVSYADSDEAELLAADFATKHVSVRRNIAGFASRRIRGSEVLIVSPDLASSLND